MDLPGAVLPGSDLITTHNLCESLLRIVNPINSTAKVEILSFPCHNPSEIIVYYIEMTIKEFNQRFVSLRPELEAVAKAMAGNGDDAEDAVQETLLRLWVRRDSLDGHPNHRALAMASLRNIIRDKWRKDQHKATAHGERLENVGMESPPMFNDEMETIRYIVDHLPPLQATVFRMKEIEGYDSKEIIAITGCSEANLRQLLSRARRKIREEFVRLNGQ